MKEKRVDRNGKMSLNRYFVDRVKLGLRLIVLSLAILSLASVMGCSKRMDYREAERLAEKELSDYCAQEKLVRTDFGGANVRPEKKYDWSVEYQSSTQPQHTLIFYLKDSKVVEFHRLVE